jgi:hypothetical protein
MQVRILLSYVSGPSVTHITFSELEVRATVAGSGGLAWLAAFSAPPESCMTNTSTAAFPVSANDVCASEGSPLNPYRWDTTPTSRSRHARSSPGSAVLPPPPPLTVARTVTTMTPTTKRTIPTSMGSTLRRLLLIVDKPLPKIISESFLTDGLVQRSPAASPGRYPLLLGLSALRQSAGEEPADVCGGSSLPIWGTRRPRRVHRSPRYGPNRRLPSYSSS